MSVPVSFVSFLEDGRFFMVDPDACRGYSIDENLKLKEFYSSPIKNVECFAACGSSSSLIWGNCDQDLCIKNFDTKSLYKIGLEYVPKIVKCNERYIVVGSPGLLEVFEYPSTSPLGSPWKSEKVNVVLTSKNLAISRHSGAMYLVYPSTSNKIAVFDPKENITFVAQTYVDGVGYIATSPKADKIAVASKDGSAIEVMSSTGDHIVKLTRGITSALIEHMDFDVTDDRLVVSSFKQTVHVFSTEPEESAFASVSSAIDAVRSTVGLGRASTYRCELPKDDLGAVCGIAKLYEDVLLAVDKYGCLHSYVLETRNFPCTFLSTTDLRNSKDTGAFNSATGAAERTERTDSDEEFVIL